MVLTSHPAFSQTNMVTPMNRIRQSACASQHPHARVDERPNDPRGTHSPLIRAPVLRFISVALLAIATQCLPSCLNPYAQFYRGLDDARLERAYEPQSGEIQIYGTSDFDSDRRGLMRRGFMPIGQSSFNAAMGNVSERQLRAQASKIGAHVVLTSSHYTNTVSGATPVQVPTTSTAYSHSSATAYGSGGTVTAYGNGTTTTYGTDTVMVPYSIERGEFQALYFAKMKMRAGIVIAPLSDEARKQLGSNAGVIADIVVEGSPAYSADVLPGDILISIGPDRIDSEASYRACLDKHEGDTVVFKFRRGAEFLEKSIKVESYDRPAQSAPPAAQH